MKPIDNHIAKPPTHEEEDQWERERKEQEMKNIKDAIEELEIEKDFATSDYKRDLLQDKIDVLWDLINEGEF